MRKQLLVLCFVFTAGMMLFQSCKKESSTESPQVGIFYSIADKQVAFTALTLRATTWLWDFGDGTTSSDKSPVHVYKDGGYYDVKLVGTNAQGDTASAKSTVAVALTPYVLLTGGATNTKGKTWKISSGSSPNDDLVNADAALSVYNKSIHPLPAGILGTGIGLGEAYDDTYTFHFDGKYSHDVKSDGAAFGSIIYELKTTGGAGIVKMSNDPSHYPLCLGKYTPQTGATFSYVEKEDYNVPSVYGPPTYVVTYKDVSTLDFSGTEFIGFMDHQRKVIIQEVTDKTMRLVMFASLSPDYYPLNTHALILTFEVVN